MSLAALFVVLVVAALTLAAHFFLRARAGSDESARAQSVLAPLAAPQVDAKRDSSEDRELADGPRGRAAPSPAQNRIWSENFEHVDWSRFPDILPGGISLFHDGQIPPPERVEGHLGDAIGWRGLELVARADNLVIILPREVDPVRPVLLSFDASSEIGGPLSIARVSARARPRPACEPTERMISRSGWRPYVVRLDACERSSRVALFIGRIVSYGGTAGQKALKIDNMELEYLH
ncbi:MAG: hypothetical protein JW940_14475 [Polyangiaceae bacterium]|nr:hypothetical protein [Polyangiaceae bacterium]